MRVSENKIIKNCEDNRKPTFEFAHFGNEEIFSIRTNINKGIDAFVI